MNILQIFECSKVYYSNGSIIINFVLTLISNWCFENIFSTYFGIEIS
jgi:hypothetical protein